MPSLKEIARRKGIVLLGSISGSAASLVLTAFMIRSAGPANYGSFVVAGSIVTFLYGIASFGSDFRYKRVFGTECVNPTRRWNAFAPQFIFQLAVTTVLALACFGLTSWLERVFQVSALPPWGIPTYLTAYILYGQVSDYFRYSGRVIPPSVMTAGLTCTQCIIVWLMWQKNATLKLNDLFGALLAALFIITAPFVWRMATELRPAKLPPLGPIIAGDIRLGYPLTINFVLDHALSSTGRYALAALVTTSALAYYNTAFLVASLALLVPRASAVVLPTLMAQYTDAGDTGRARDLLLWTTRLFLVLGVPFVLGSFLLEPMIMLVFATAEVAAKAKYVIPLLAVGQVAAGLIVIWSTAFFVSKQMKTLLGINIAAAGINVLATLVALYLHPKIILAAACFAFSYLFSAALMARKMSREWHLSSAFSFWPPILAGSIVMTCVLLLMPHWLEALSPATALFVLTLTGFFVYGLVLALFGRRRMLLLLTFNPAGPAPYA